MLSVFEFERNKVRVLVVNGEFWFVGKDVATILGYTDLNQAVRQHCDKEDTISDVELRKKLSELSQSNNDVISRAVYINESGLYSLIFGSTKDEAKAFKRWLTKEVLPSIRKTGSYSVEQKPSLPVHEIALQKARAIAEIDEILSYQPKLAQFLIDFTISDLMAQKQLSGVDLKGVVELAEKMKLPVNLDNRCQLGKFVKKQVGHLAKDEKRLVNGQMRNVACYPDTDEVRKAIKLFFEQ